MAGGRAGNPYEPYYNGCMDTYQEGEWCWITDSCMLLTEVYDNTPDDQKTVYETHIKQQGTDEDIFNEIYGNPFDDNTL